MDGLLRQFFEQQAVHDQENLVTSKGVFLDCRNHTTCTVFSLLSVVSQLGCSERQAPEAGAGGTWRSKFHDISLYYSREWTLIRPYVDTQDAVTVGVVDNRNGMSLIIKLTEGAPRDVVSDEAYFQAVKDQMLAHAVGNKFVREFEASFLGKPYHCMQFTMDSKKFNGPFRQDAYVRRTGKTFVACQINYPIATNTDSAYETPQQLKSLLERLELP